MKTCLGPCVHKEVREEYQEMVAKVRQILKGNTRECIQGLRSAMEEMAETFQFEKAIVLREQIQELSNLEKEQISEYGKEIDEDVFVWKEVYERMFLCVLNVREGKILGKISSNFYWKRKCMKIWKKNCFFLTIENIRFRKVLFWKRNISKC